MESFNRGVSAAGGGPDMLIVGSIPMKEKLFFVGQNERKSNSMKKLSSCSIFGVEVGLIKN